MGIFSSFMNTFQTKTKYEGVYLLLGRLPILGTTMVPSLKLLYNDTECNSRADYEYAKKHIKICPYCGLKYNKTKAYQKMSEAQQQARKVTYTMSTDFSYSSMLDSFRCKCLSATCPDCKQEYHILYNFHC